MIFEVLIVLFLVVGVVMSIVYKAKQKSTEGIRVFIFCVCLLILVLAFAVDDASKASVYSTYDLNPLKYIKLQQMSNQKYVIHSTSNGQYYFMHDGVMNDTNTKRVLIVNIEDSKFDEPTIIECFTKPSFWRSFILSRLDKCIIYVLVINEDQILEQNTKQNETLPEWLSSHSGRVFYVFCLLFCNSLYVPLSEIASSNSGKTPIEFSSIFSATWYISCPG